METGLPSNGKDQEKKTREQLEEEVERLKRLTKLLGTGCPCVSDVMLPSNDVIATVVYYNKTGSSQYREKLEKFIQSFKNEHNEIDIDNDDNEDDQLEEPVYQHNTVAVRSGICSSQLDCTCQTNSVEISGLVEYHSEFVLDWLGAPMIIRASQYCLPDSLRVIYEQVYNEPFWVSGYEEREGLRLRRITMRCFNCDDFHHIKNCPEPINPFNVARNKRHYLQDFGIFGSDKRYYLELAEHERFHKFQPGIISSKLRAALGLSDKNHTPPLYILRMRELGYPPGWRQIQEEYLKMFDEAGQEIQIHNQAKKDIIYPGFNDKPKTQEDTSSKLLEVIEDDDLGHISDYEFEMEDEGGFSLKKLIKNQVQKKDNKEERLLPQKRSIDFPPGLVGEPSEPIGRWKDLMKIIETYTSTKRQKTHSGNSYV